MKTLPDSKIRQIQKLKSKGLSNRQIAAKLHVSKESAGKYGSNIQKTVTAQNKPYSGLEIEIEHIFNGDTGAESMINKMLQTMDTQVLKNMIEQNLKLKRIILNEIKRREVIVNNTTTTGWSI